MDQHTEFVQIKRRERAMDSLKKHGFSVSFAENQDEVYKVLSGHINHATTTSVGGSMTLFQLGVVDWLRYNCDTFYDRYEEGLSKEDILGVYHKAMTCDVYLSSAQAVTETGEILLVDGFGNRVGAVCYGPKKVLLIVGENKIVANEEAAVQRNQQIAAPANVDRLSRQTPCATLGMCTDCNSKERVCNTYVTIKRNMADRIHVMIVGGNYGY